LGRNQINNLSVVKQHVQQGIAIANCVTMRQGNDEAGVRSNQWPDGSPNTVLRPELLFMQIPNAMPNRAPLVK
jgi:hypothetical protein